MKLETALSRVQELLEANSDSSNTFEGTLAGQWLKAIETLHAYATAQACYKMVSDKTPYAIVTVEGGVADLSYTQNGAQVDILDYDNLKDTDGQSTIELSEGEAKYLRKYDREFWNRIRKQVVTL